MDPARGGRPVLDPRCHTAQCSAGLGATHGPRPTEAHWLWVEAIGTGDTPPHATLRGALSGVRGAIAITTLVLGMALFVAGWLWPVGLGTLLGGLLLLMLWGATWLPISSLISYAGNKSGLPILSLLLLLAVVFSIWNDNYDIRRAPGGITPLERLTVDAALEQ